DGSLDTVCERCDKVISTTPIKQIKTIKLSATSYVYDGKTKTPSVTVTDVNGKKLIKNTDYTLKYSSGRKNPGNYKVKVTFKGNYTGSKTYSYKITPAKTTVKAKQSTTSIKLTWTPVTGAYGYRVYLYDSSSKKWTTLIKATKETSYTFKSLTPGTTYRYAVRPYARDGGVIWAKYTDIYVTTKPATPSLSSAESGAKNSFTAKWNTVTGATGYVVYYAKSKNGSYKKLGSTKDRTFTSTKLSGGRTYYIRIKAYIKTDSGNIYSGASNIKSVYVK
ncbi:MAG: fibronectin type III domain-containing protein, partial [Clostridia bacterium]|nr:fibronectin type III domain-containing protein [Clostridia bacterium]